MRADVIGSFIVTALFSGAALLGCGAGSTTPEPDDSELTAAPEPELKGANPQDAPEISRSVGEQGGAVVFWPRVVPPSDDPAIAALAAEVQKQLADAAQKAGVGPIDVRPEPERVCPKDGCAAMTVGAVLVSAKGGCSVVGLVAAAGQGDTHIVPWQGLVKLKAETVPFRDPPESQLTIRDNVPCKDLKAQLGESREDLIAKIQSVAGGS